MSFLHHVSTFLFVSLCSDFETSSAPVSEKDIGKTITAINRIVYSYEWIIKKAKIPGQSAYIGCFQMTHEWRDDFVVAAPLMLVTDVGKCIEACWKRRQRFALLKEGRTCSCAVTLRSLTEGSNSDCTSPCLGNSNQACGSPAHFSVYYTGYIEEPPFTKFTVEFGKKHFIGCYYDNDKSTLCPFSFTTLRMRAAMCMDVCEENAYRYAAITLITQCCCTNQIDQPAQPVDLTKCPAACGESDPTSKETCGSGSPYHFSVYRTGLFGNVEDYQRPKYDQVWMHPSVNDADIKTIERQ